MWLENWVNYLLTWDFCSDCSFCGFTYPEVPDGIWDNVKPFPFKILFTHPNTVPTYIHYNISTISVCSTEVHISNSSANVFIIIITLSNIYRDRDTAHFQFNNSCSCVKNGSICYWHALKSNRNWKIPLGLNYIKKKNLKSKSLGSHLTRTGTSKHNSHFYFNKVLLN